MSENVADIVNDYESGYGIGALGNKYGKSKTVIRKILVNSGVTIRGKGRPKRGSVPDDAAQYSDKRTPGIPRKDFEGDGGAYTPDRTENVTITKEDYGVLGRKNTI